MYTITKCNIRISDNCFYINYKTLNYSIFIDTSVNALKNINMYNTSVYLNLFGYTFISLNKVNNI